MEVSGLHAAIRRMAKNKRPLREFELIFKCLVAWLGKEFKKNDGIVSCHFPISISLETDFFDT